MGHEISQDFMRAACAMRTFFHLEDISIRFTVKTQCAWESFDAGNAKGRLPCPRGRMARRHAAASWRRRCRPRFLGFEQYISMRDLNPGPGPFCISHPAQILYCHQGSALPLLMKILIGLDVPQLPGASKLGRRVGTKACRPAGRRW